MNFRQIKVFLRVCENKSFSKTAQELFVAQSSISKQIQALEKELGTELIKRNHGQLFELTNAGKAYYKTFHEIEYKIVHTALRVNSEQEDKKIFRIGCFQAWYIPELIKKCDKMAERLFPDYVLEFESITFADMKRRRDYGKFDLIFTISAEYKNSIEFSMTILGTIHSVLVTSSNHKAVDGKRIHADLLENEMYYIVPESETERINMNSIYRLFGQSKLMLKECISERTIRMNLLAGKGYSVADELTVYNFDDRYAACLLADIEVPVIAIGKGTDHELAEKLIFEFKNWVADTRREKKGHYYELLR